MNTFSRWNEKLDWTKVPILEEQINRFTRKTEGDDDGFRNVPVRDNGDPLVPVDDVKTALMYNQGIIPKYTVWHPPVGAPDKAYVREPVLAILHEANRRLKPYNDELVLIDSFRSVAIQAAAFKAAFEMVAKTQKCATDTVPGRVRIGRLTNKVVLFADVNRGTKFQEALIALKRNKSNEVKTAATQEDVSETEAATLFLIFGANIGKDDLSLNTTANTAHGNGGAVDLALKNRPMGTAVDYIAPTAYNPFFMNHLEDPKNWSKFKQAVSEDRNLQTYLAGWKRSDATDEYLEVCMKARRLLFHAMSGLGCTHYFEESCHFNAPCLNGRGRKHWNGNPCQAILTGNKVACWGNRVAHRMYRELVAGK